jgi:hypothetical protein
LIITAHRLRVLEAALLFSVLPIAHRLLTWRRLLGLSGVSVEPYLSELGPAKLPLAQAVARAVMVAAMRLPWRPLCLSQALVAGIMLRLRGRRSVLCLGVRKDGNTLGGHAWLVLPGDEGGVVCGGASIENVRALRRLDEDARGG